MQHPLIVTVWDFKAYVGIVLLSVCSMQSIIAVNPGVYAEFIYSSVKIAYISSLATKSIIGFTEFFKNSLKILNYTPPSCKMEN